MKHKNKSYDVEISLHFPSFLFQILDIPKKTFPKLYELHTIDFSYNNITEIDRSVFVNLLGLRHLNFTHNHLEQIESSTFGKVPTLLNIDLSYNFLKKVQRGAFGGILHCLFISYFLPTLHIDEDTLILPAIILKIVSFHEVPLKAALGGQANNGQAALMGKMMQGDNFQNYGEKDQCIYMSCVCTQIVDKAIYK